MSECGQMLRRELRIVTTPEVEGWNGALENNGSLVLRGQVAVGKGSCVACFVRWTCRSLTLFTGAYISNSAAD